MKRNSINLKYAEGYLVAFKNSFCENEICDTAGTTYPIFRCPECEFRLEDHHCILNTMITRLERGDYNE